MKKHIWFEVTATDSVRVKKLVRQFRQLVGQQDNDCTRRLLEAYQGNITEETAHTVGNAVDAIEDMIQYAEQTAAVSDAITEMSIFSLQGELQKEQNRLASILYAFKKEGVDID